MNSRETFGDRTRTHGATDTPLYSVWCGMKYRCYNPHYKHFSHYGGRGIKVCNEWKNSFEAFRAWAIENGYNDSLSGKEQSLDRIDVNGNYEPSNCRWATQLEQARNRGDTVYLNYNGVPIAAREFAKTHNICDYVFVFRRAKKGEDGEKILHDWTMHHSAPTDYMDINEATKYYGVTNASIRAWIKNGRLYAEKCGNKWYIKKGQEIERRGDRDQYGRFLPRNSK